MATQTITMHRLLTELKSYDARIETAMNQNFIMVVSNAGKDADGHIETQRNLIQGNYDSITHLISNRISLEKERLRSNAVTKVSVGGIEYTVNEAIAMKRLLRYKIDLLNKIQQQYNAAVDKKQSDDIRLYDSLTRATAELFGKESISSENTSDNIKKFQEDYLALRESKVIDPNNLIKEIEKLQKEVTSFYNDIDAALSVSNALTTVTVNLED